MGKQRAVFLDRDGVLIRSFVQAGVPRPPGSFSDVQILPGVPSACSELREGGFRLICVTNQPDIARGTITAEAVAEVNEYVRAELGLDAVLMCPHDDADDCPCRKPRPGMLLDAAELFDLDLGHSVMVGDRWRDIEAGRRAGCRTVFVQRGYAERQPEDPDLVVHELSDAVPWILFRA